MPVTASSSHVKSDQHEVSWETDHASPLSVVLSLCLLQRDLPAHVAGTLHIVTASLNYAASKH